MLVSSFAFAQNLVTGPGPRKRGFNRRNASDKVYLDGREELIRNAEFVGIQASTFKDIIAVSKEVFSYNAHYSARTPVPFGNSGFTTGMIGVVVPAGILFEDITVKPPSGEILKPPVSRHPFFAESGSLQ